MDKYGTVKSFVIRGGRMREYRKKAFDELYEKHSVSNDPNTWLEFYTPFQRRILEIGFGMGHATVAMAATNPDWGIIGIEVHPPGVARVLQEIEDRSLKNLKILKDDALTLLMKIPHHLLDGIHVYFPDPWPKNRHQRRRLVKLGFLENAGKILKQGGYLHFVTDWEDYALEVRGIIQGLKGWKIEGTEWSTPRIWRIQTKFEARALKDGRLIFEIYALH